MKKLTKLMMLFLLILIAPIALGVGAENHKKHEASVAEKYTPTSHKINRIELDELLTKPDEVLIIDLRRPDEVSKIGGFPVYLSIQADQLEKNLDFIPKERSIVTVSNHSGRSGKSADLLASKGFKVAGYVGAQYYEEEGGKLTKISLPLPKPHTKHNK